MTQERCPIDRSVCLPMIKTAFHTGLRDLLWRLDARMESPTHQKQPTCLAYEFALVQGVNILWECRQPLPAAAHEKVNNIKVAWRKNSQ